ncbi:MAG: ribonuclease D [Sphingomonadales bacterium]|nr:ribonuclease D [Sphingomonadales bacterium]
MTPITSTDELNKLCQRLEKAAYITVDTEFLRTSTYYSKLCLIQVADEDGAFAIDPLANGLNLDEFFKIMNECPAIKVFHASRQDIEIFYQLSGKVPTPIFDTQIGAMVCGFGEQVGYETLVQSICNASLDKSIRFTDWSKRPLSDRQVDYAISDVTHLRDIYKHLTTQLEKSGRAAWLEEEMHILTSDDTYEQPPEDAWLRIKTRTNNRNFLGRLRELAALREREAQKMNQPRNRVIRDEVLLEIAAHPPKAMSELETVRSLANRYNNGRGGQLVMDALANAHAMNEEDLPLLPKRKDKFEKAGPVLELLKVLLKQVSKEKKVATKLIATGGDLEALALGRGENLALMRGWRHEIFGQRAMDLLDGKIFLSAKGTNILITDKAEG